MTATEAKPFSTAAESPETVTEQAPARGTDREAAERSAVERRRDWRAQYSTRLFVTDLVLVTGAMALAYLVRFGPNDAVTAHGGVSYTGVAVLFVAGWVLSLQIAGSRDYRVLGTGVQEYQRLFQATFGWFGAVAIICVAFKLDIARGFSLIALPVGLVALLIGRKAWRTWLVRRRVRTGEHSSAVVVVGSGHRTSVVVRELLRSPASGYRLVGVALPEGDQLDEDLHEHGLPVGRLHDAVPFMRRLGGDTIAVSGGEALRGIDTKRMSWQLEAGKEHMVLSAGLLDVAGPRMSMRPVAGLSLIHVETPRLTGWRALAKGLMDYVGAGLLTIVLSPVLLVVALLVKITDPGPVLYKQQRIGQSGKPFQMLKFRSMVVNADQQLTDLLAEQGTSGTPLFKIQDDPRVTRIGGVLRRYSLDELPQLFNVLIGSMSLVGPRPQVPAEVQLYDDAAHRRLLVKPGLTGLWQVSGRSDLNWEEAIRLDLYYVENWSMTGDLQILTRTLRAVFGSNGAY